MSFNMILIYCIALSGLLMTHAQQCGSNQFTIKNENGDDYLTINSPTVVKTCGGINICDEINLGKQTLALSSNGQEILISNGNSVQLPDSSVTNELQTLSLDSSGTLSISQGNQVKLGDNSPTNEIQTLSLDSSGRLSISQGNQVTLADNNATNELQTLSLDSAGTLSLSQGNQVTLGDNSNTNELQTLALAGTMLSISSQNTVDLAAMPTGRAAFKFFSPVGTTIATIGFSIVADITVTPPDYGNILTRFCGTIYSPVAGLKGYTFGFNNASVGAIPYGRSGVYESADGESYGHICTEWWWPVITPNVPVSFYVVAQSKIAGCGVVTAQLSAIYFYGGI